MTLHLLSHRGTNSHSLYNWIDDVEAYRVADPLDIPGTAGAYVHSGFYRLWNSSGLYKSISIAMTHIIEEIGWGNPVYIAGHSMGGALATLCSMYMTYAFTLTNVRLYTYGSPRVGNEVFYEMAKKMVSGLLTISLILYDTQQYFEGVFELPARFFGILTP